MIEVTRLNGSVFILNANLIETVEANPDTVVTLVNSHRYVVKESLAEIVEKAAAYQGKRWPPSLT
ncbi:MAG: flagellar protein FlbD [Synergistales bacterium]|nr:flagellar FlbD family protein [Dethiosulfovibrio sp.]NCC96744.1 flagellar protein FlbD [Synergistales bacterium]